MYSEKRKKLFAMSVLIFAAVGGVLYGYDLGIIAGAMLFIRRDIPMSVDELSVLVGAVFGGGAIATLVTGPLADIFGRRKMIMLSSLVFIVGVLLVYYSTNFTEVMWGRVIQGLGVGIITIAVPLYLAESVPGKLRGVGVSVFQLLLTAGILFAALVGLYFTPTGDWRGMFLTALVPGLVMFFGCFALSDSPRYLVMKGQYQKAREVLARFRPADEVDLVLNRMKQAREKHLSRAAGEIVESLFQKRFIKPLLMGIGIAMLNQLIGTNAILQLSAYLLKSTGLQSNMVAMVGGTMITGLNFIVTLIAMFLVDRLPRKLLYSIGTGGLTLALICAGLTLQLLPHSVLQGHLLLTSILFFIGFYAMGPGMLVWVVLSEVMPTRIRSTGMAIALCLNSFISFGFSAIFIKLSTMMGDAGIFFVCAGFGLVYFLMTSLVLPETKGKSLEEIEHSFEEAAGH